LFIPFAAFRRQKFAIEDRNLKSGISRLFEFSSFFQDSPGLFLVAPRAQPNAGAASVLVDEFDAY
jgi:hypothetical protein